MLTACSAGAAFSGPENAAPGEYAVNITGYRFFENG